MTEFKIISSGIPEAGEPQPGLPPDEPLPIPPLPQKLPIPVPPLPHPPP